MLLDPFVQCGVGHICVVLTQDESSIISSSLQIGPCPVTYFLEPLLAGSQRIRMRIAFYYVILAPFLGGWSGQFFVGP